MALQKDFWGETGDGRETGQQRDKEGVRQDSKATGQGEDRRQKEEGDRTRGTDRKRSETGQQEKREMGGGRQNGRAVGKNKEMARGVGRIYRWRVTGREVIKRDEEGRKRKKGQRGMLLLCSCYLRWRQGHNLTDPPQGPLGVRPDNP